MTNKVNALLVGLILLVASSISVFAYSNDDYAQAYKMEPYDSAVDIGYVRDTDVAHGDWEKKDYERRYAGPNIIERDDIDIEVTDIYLMPHQVFMDALENDEVRKFYENFFKTHESYTKGYNSEDSCRVVARVRNVGKSSFAGNIQLNGEATSENYHTEMFGNYMYSTGSDGEAKLAPGDEGFIVSLDVAGASEGIGVLTQSELEKHNAKVSGKIILRQDNGHTIIYDKDLTNDEKTIKAEYCKTDMPSDFGRTQFLLPSYAHNQVVPQTEPYQTYEVEEHNGWYTWQPLVLHEGDDVELTLYYEDGTVNDASIEVLGVSWSEGETMAKVRINGQWEKEVYAQSNYMDTEPNFDNPEILPPALDPSLKARLVLIGAEKYADAAVGAKPGLIFAVQSKENFKVERHGEFHTSTNYGGSAGYGGGGVVVYEEDEYTLCVQEAKAIFEQCLEGTAQYGPEHGQECEDEFEHFMLRCEEEGNYYEGELEPMEEYCDDGCFVNSDLGRCVPTGTRFLYSFDKGAEKEAAYCHYDGDIKVQKEAGAEAQNNYECTTNYASKGKCEDTIGWLQKLFEALAFWR